MNKTLKILLISVPIIGIAYYINKKLKGKSTENIDSSASSSTDSAEKEEKKSNPAITIDRNKTLKVGMISPEVKVIQKALGKLDVDGVFGKGTASRLFDVLRLSEISINEYNKDLPKSGMVKVIHDRGKKIDVKKTYNQNYDYLKNYSLAVLNNKPTFKFLFKTYRTTTGLPTVTLFN
jgi:hypothetical protein